MPGVGGRSYDRIRCCAEVKVRRAPDSNATPHFPALFGRRRVRHFHPDSKRDSFAGLMPTFGQALYARFTEARAEKGALTPEEWVEVADSFYRQHCASHRRPCHPLAAEGGASPVYLALCRAEGSNPAELTTPEKRRLGIVEMDIRRTMAGRSDDEIAREVENRAAKYRLQFPRVTLTANALLNRWASLNGYGAKVRAESAAVYRAQPTASDEQWEERHRSFGQMLKESGLL